PIASQEGFVRQVLGWREFVRHVHEATDGFRAVPGLPPAPDGDPRFLGADEPLPRAFWEGARSGLACLDGVVEAVWRDGHSHHITRLMVLSNLATLLGVSARELADWFWVAYDDAFDWVVEPNVIGMGTFAAGDAMTTKPYVSGSAYLHRMGDWCGACAFDPARDCPVTPLYWAFLARNADTLRGNQRLRMPLASLARRAAPDRRRDEAVRQSLLAALREGLPFAPDAPRGDGGEETGGGRAKRTRPTKRGTRPTKRDR
ncbi:MAG: FAD-binding domain-containing protein, partial [Alphaproteobacteria bacterium]